MGSSWLGLMKHSTADDRGANWLCASRQPSDVLTTETGDGQVDKLLRVVGHDKTEAAPDGPGPSSACGSHPHRERVPRVLLDQATDLGLGERGLTQGRYELGHQRVVGPERTAARFADVEPTGVVG